MVREEEIRKRDIFNKYLALVKKDAEESFEHTSFVDINCPGCKNRDFIFEFEKIGFKYVSCKNCATLFANPRPPFEALRDFYSSSSSTNFWINEFFKPVAEVRREKIFRPRAEYISKMINRDNQLVIGDVGAGFGLFLEELRKLLPYNRYIAIEPSVEMSGICKEKGLEVQCCTLEEIDGFEEYFDLLTTFELIEHLYNPRHFLSRARALLKPGGCFLMTTLNVLGFDIQLLWEKSKSIHPPHHLNFFNPSSIAFLLKDCGLEAIEISTPGQLDWDIVEGMIKNERVKLGRFWDTLAHSEDEQCKKELQNWISKNKLSSHMRIIAKKI